MAIKVGFVGAGGRARGHMKTLAEIEDVEFGAICDVVEATAQAAADQYGGNVYTDYKVMLDSEELDAMYVVVPTFAHFDAETMAARVELSVDRPQPTLPQQCRRRQMNVDPTEPTSEKAAILDELEHLVVGSRRAPGQSPQ